MSENLSKHIYLAFNDVCGHDATCRPGQQSVMHNVESIEMECAQQVAVNVNLELGMFLEMQRKYQNEIAIK